MLHRYIFTFTLIFTFGLSQLGLLAHDVSHIKQHLAVSLEAKTSTLADRATGISSNENRVGDKASIGNSKNTKASANLAPKQKPLVADQHTCEKCVGFAGITYALQQASIFISQALTDSQPSNVVKAFHYERITLHQLARAPPHSLV